MNTIIAFPNPDQWILTVVHILLMTQTAMESRMTSMPAHMLQGLLKTMVVPWKP